jgi:hypothetical protein
MPWTRIPCLAVFASLLATAAEDRRTPVVVELFTSEGCSSCPPADQLLARLDKAQPVQQADILVLEEHVDYWDQQGWRDPFSDHFFTLRQQAYARAFAADDVYTPQMVVDGRAGFVGGDAAHALREIRGAAAVAHASVRIQRKDDASLTLTAGRFPAGAKGLEIILAVAEDALASDVLHGENAGRRLSHAPVARSLVSVAKFDARKSPEYTSDVPLHLMPAWNRKNLRLIAFVQDRDNHRILGAASLRP